MAKEQEFNVSGEPTIYFYVNKESALVEYVSMYTIFGTTVRPKGASWRLGTRDELAKYYSSQYEIWSYDWDTADDSPGSGADLDPRDEDSWEIEFVQQWAKGADISREDIESTFRLVNSGEYISAEEAESIPGE